MTHDAARLGLVEVLHEPEEGELVEKDLGEVDQQILATVTHPDTKHNSTFNVLHVQSMNIHWIRHAYMGGVLQV